MLWGKYTFKKIIYPCIYIFILFHLILFYFFQEKRALLKTLLSREDGAEEGSEGEEEEDEDESEVEEEVIYILSGLGSRQIF